LPLLVEQPRLVHCFGLEVDDAGPASASLRGYQLGYSWPGGSPMLRAGVEHELVVEIKDSSSGKPVSGLKDLQVMALELPGISQLRRRAEEVAPGRYLVKQRLPRGGKWRLSAQSLSLGLRFDESTSLDVVVQEIAELVEAAADGGSAAPQVLPDDTLVEPEAGSGLGEKAPAGTATGPTTPAAGSKP
jgi:hypothetical protein